MRILFTLLFAASACAQTAPLPDTPKPHKPISRTWQAASVDGREEKA